jgi:hypothetical protein
MKISKAPKPRTNLQIFSTQRNFNLFVIKGIKERINWTLKNNSSVPETSDKLITIDEQLTLQTINVSIDKILKNWKPNHAKLKARVINNK